MRIAVVAPRCYDVRSRYDVHRGTSVAQILILQNNSLAKRHLDKPVEGSTGVARKEVVVVLLARSPVRHKCPGAKCLGVRRIAQYYSFRQNHDGVGRSIRKACCGLMPGGLGLILTFRNRRIDIISWKRVLSLEPQFVCCEYTTRWCMYMYSVNFMLAGLASPVDSYGQDALKAML